jgi:hypothetical protein
MLEPVLQEVARERVVRVRRLPARLLRQTTSRATLQHRAPRCNIARHARASRG